MKDHFNTRNNKKPIQHNNLDWRENKVGKVLSLYTTDPGYILAPYIIPECQKK